jgi:mannose-1-phosphate guanylyltransferase/mannose-1-phosphate guanylyltransferase/phosphomannomutase
MKAMLLAAGLGTRLRPLTYELPKPMVPILGRPVMEHILRLLERHGFDDVVANLHYFPDLIRDRFGDGSEYGVRLVYSYEPELMGTAGGVRNVRDHFGGETFLIISGDALTDIDLTALWQTHKRKGGIATLALKRVDDPSQLGVVIVNDDGRIQGFQEKPAPAEALSNLGNCGIYVFEPEIFDYFPEPEFVDWAMDVFPKLLEQDVSFYGHEFPEYWNDVGSLEEYRQGNFDALAGAVHVDMGELSGSNGVRLAPGAQLPDDTEVEGQVFIGEGCRIAGGVRLTGPVVIGEGSRIGEGAAIRDTVVWPRTDVDPGTVLIGAVAGERPLAEKL